MAGNLRQTMAKLAPQPSWTEPCIPTLVEKPPSGPNWRHEAKWDGYRVAIVICDGEGSGRSGVERRDELASSHSISSSAAASKVEGISRPSAFAVARLIANLIDVACSIGRSPGWAPLRMRSA
jgi:hypothetical protein